MCLSEPVSHLLEQSPSTLQAVTMIGEPGTPPCLQQCQSDATKSLRVKEEELGDKRRQRDIGIMYQKQKVAELGNREESTDLPREPHVLPSALPPSIFSSATRRKAFRKRFLPFLNKTLVASIG